MPKPKVKYTPEQQYQALLGTMVNMDESRPRFMGCLYGDLGTGKTVFSARIANAIGGRWLYIDTAEEFTTLRINKRWQPLIANLVRMRYAGVSQIKAVAESINNKRPGFEFDGIILDKSTSMADQEVIKVTRARAEDDPSKDPEEPKQPDMNVTTVIMKEAFAALVNTPCHIIHVASVRKDKNNLNIEVTGPGFMPKLSTASTEPMQIVAFCTADIKANVNQEEYVRWAQVAPSTTIVAKSRIDGLGVKVSHETIIEAAAQFAHGERAEVPDMPPILEAIEPTIAASTDDVPIY